MNVSSILLSTSVPRIPVQVSRVHHVCEHLFLEGRQYLAKKAFSTLRKSLLIYYSRQTQFSDPNRRTYFSWWYMFSSWRKDECSLNTTNRQTQDNSISSRAILIRTYLPVLPHSLHTRVSAEFILVSIFSSMNQRLRKGISIDHSPHRCPRRCDDRNCLAS